MNQNTTARKAAVCGLIAALYAVLGVAFAPIGFGPVQLRVAEALTILPIFTPYATWGLTLGCALTNLYGLSVGANIIGVADIFIGTAATLLAALATRGLRKFTFHGLPVAATIPPILFNALVVGGELTYVMSPGGWNWAIFAVNFLQVGVGQFLACSLLGLPLARALERTGLGGKQGDPPL